MAYNKTTGSKIELLDMDKYPLVHIKKDTLDYINEIVSVCDEEVSWIFHVERDGRNYHIGDKVFIPNQRVHATTTEFEADDIITMLQQEPEFNHQLWRGWGHSHVKMPVNPSAQDRDTMIEFAGSCPFFLGMIHNKNGNIYSWIVDVDANSFYLDVPITVEGSNPFKEEVEGLVKDRVKPLKDETKTTTTTTPSTNTNNNTKNASRSEQNSKVKDSFTEDDYKAMYDVDAFSDEALEKMAEGSKKFMEMTDSEFNKWSQKNAI